MEYENMRMPELKSLARDRGLRNYSRMRKAELVALLQNDPPPAPRTRPPRSTRPLPPTQTWEPVDDRRPRKPSPQEMDIFEQQEMSKSRPQVKGKLSKWYDWLINHVPKPIKDGASKAFNPPGTKGFGTHTKHQGGVEKDPPPSISRTRNATNLKPLEGLGVSFKVSKNFKLV